MVENNDHNNKNIKSTIADIAWSCWYVVEDLWRLITPFVRYISKIMWRILKPLSNHTSQYVSKQVRLHRSGTASIILHILIILLLVVEFDFAQKKEIKKPNVISIELLQLKLPVKEKTNIKPKKVSKVVKPKIKPPVKKLTTKPKPPKAPHKKIAKKPKIKPQVKPKAKPSKIKPIIKPVKKQSFAEMAAKLNKLEDKTEPEPDQHDYNPTIPLSISEKDLIRSQLVQCWNILPGADETKNATITVRFKLHRDGSVSGRVNVVNNSRYNKDSVFRAAADRAVSAVIKCSPLKGLPEDKYKQWSEMEFNFTPNMI